MCLNMTELGYQGWAEHLSEKGLGILQRKMRCWTYFLSLGSSFSSTVGPCPLRGGGVGRGDRCASLREGEGFLEEVLSVLHLEAWSESRSVEMAERWLARASKAAGTGW